MKVDFLKVEKDNKRAMMLIEEILIKSGTKAEELFYLGHKINSKLESINSNFNSTQHNNQKSINNFPEIHNQSINYNNTSNNNNAYNKQSEEELEIKFHCNNDQEKLLKDTFINLQLKSSIYSMRREISDLKDEIINLKQNEKISAYSKSKQELSKKTVELNYLRDCYLKVKLKLEEVEEQKKALEVDKEITKHSNNKSLQNEVNIEKNSNQIAFNKQVAELEKQIINQKNINDRINKECINLKNENKKLCEESSTLKLSIKKSNDEKKRFNWKILKIEKIKELFFLKVDVIKKEEDKTWEQANKRSDKEMRITNNDKKNSKKDFKQNDLKRNSSNNNNKISNNSLKKNDNKKSNNDLKADNDINPHNVKKEESIKINDQLKTESNKYIKKDTEKEIKKEIEKHIDHMEKEISINESNANANKNEEKIINISNKDLSNVERSKDINIDNPNDKDENIQNSDLHTDTYNNNIANSISIKQDIQSKENDISSSNDFKEDNNANFTNDLVYNKPNISDNNYNSNYNEIKDKVLDNMSYIEKKGSNNLTALNNNLLNDDNIEDNDKEIEALMNKDSKEIDPDNKEYEKENNLIQNNIKDINTENNISASENDQSLINSTLKESKVPPSNNKLYATEINQNTNLAKLEMMINNPTIATKHKLVNISSNGEKPPHVTSQPKAKKKFTIINEEADNSQDENAYQKKKTLRKIEEIKNENKRFPLKTLNSHSHRKANYSIAIQQSTDQVIDPNDNFFTLDKSFDLHSYNSHQNTMKRVKPKSTKQSFQKLPTLDKVLTEKIINQDFDSLMEDPQMKKLFDKMNINMVD